MVAASVATFVGAVPLARTEGQPPPAKMPLAAGWDAGVVLPARLSATLVLLLDLARVPEGRAAVHVLSGLLEHLWAELVEAQLPTKTAEQILHRLSNTYAYGTLRAVHVQQLEGLFVTLGISSVLDPLAHNGFHAHLLASRGLLVEAADSSPAAACWGGVIPREARATPWEQYGRGWALFLSWLPHWSEVGFEALNAFQGDVVVVLGDQGDWTGTDRFREEVNAKWELVGSWDTKPPWPRVAERLDIYARKAAHHQA